VAVGAAVAIRRAATLLSCTVCATHYSRGQISDQTSLSCAGHNGPAETGKNAGVKVPIANATSSPAEGSAILTDAQAADLMAGKYYVNVHTAANPGGEIRGQVTK